MTRYTLGMDNRFKKNVEIGLYAQNIDTFMDSISNTIKMAYVTFNGERKSSLQPLQNFMCLLIKLEKTIFLIHNT